jgi:hypothetical protein
MEARGAEAHLSRRMRVALTAFEELVFKGLEREETS